MIYKITNTFIGILFIAGLVSCTGIESQTKNSQADKASEKRISKAIKIPAFNADSAYSFIKKQVDFGPRTPASVARDNCAIWLRKKLQSYTNKVVVQDFKTRGWDGKIYDGKNIIASFNPENKARIILSAHYDSRPYSDHDPDENNFNKALDGANDGASGVGVLVEIARLMAEQAPQIGIDIIFWDMEDFGPPTWANVPNEDDYWALGSQYWAQNLDQNTYRARFAILLDMVGGADNVFPKEYFSNEYAPQIVSHVWNIAEQLGYGGFFIDEPGLAVNDDHLPLNKFAGIPAIDIIGMERDGNNFAFYKNWHTQKDNIDGISKPTIEMVGKVVTQVVYTED